MSDKDHHGELTPPQTIGAMPNLRHDDTLEGRNIHGNGDQHDHHVHVTPFWPMVGTFAALILLTILTVATARFIYLGNAVNLVIALLIAGTKAILVAAFFMHLLYDKALNTIVVVSTMFAVVLFISLTTIDMGTRGMASDLEEGEIVPGGGARITIDEDGNRSVARLGSYQPWHSETPSKSVAQQAHDAYMAEKAHAGDKQQDGQAAPGDNPGDTDTPSDSEPAAPQNPDEDQQANAR